MGGSKPSAPHRGVQTAAAGQAAGTLLRPFGNVARMVAGWFVRASDIVLLWLHRDRQRRALQELSDDMLKDIGLSRCDVDPETSKPFWRE